MFEIVVTRNYNENTFKDDMKRLYNALGVENKRTVFLFTAAQVCTVYCSVFVPLVDVQPC